MAPNGGWLTPGWLVMVLVPLTTQNGYYRLGRLKLKTVFFMIELI